MAEQGNDLPPPGSDDPRSREDRPKQRFETFIPDMVRRTFYAGLGAIFTSEEGLRRLANDFSLPKDVATYFITQAQSTKNELFRIFAAEIRRFLEDMRLNEELQRLLASMTIELKTEVRFVPHDEELRASVQKSRVRVRRHSGRRAKRDEVDDWAEGAEEGAAREEDETSNRTGP